MRILGSHLTLTKFRNPQLLGRLEVSPAIDSRPDRITPSERTPKKIPPHCCRYQETDLELTKKKTPPLHSNSPPSRSNTHTHTQRYKVSPFRFYIYRLPIDNLSKDPQHQPSRTALLYTFTWQTEHCLKQRECLPAILLQID
jgi:hypothetical protein